MATRDQTRRRTIGIDGAAGQSRVFDRRTFGQRLAWTAIGALGMTGGLASALTRSAAASHHEKAPAPKDLLEGSPFVYISPLLADGSESTCHAEVWYAWIDESVVVTVASDRWKAGALARGLDRARIWVGDHGLWNTWYGGHNEAFKTAQHFDAHVEKVESTELLERLLARYEEKYPDEIENWRDIMRTGNADGSRVLLRYTPIRT
jgi:hypothetical protein